MFLVFWMSNDRCCRLIFCCIGMLALFSSSTCCAMVGFEILRHVDLLSMLMVLSMFMDFGCAFVFSTSVL